MWLLEIEKASSDYIQQKMFQTLSDALKYIQTTQNATKYIITYIDSE